VGISFFIGTALAIFFLSKFGNLMQREFSIDLLKSPLFIFSLPGIFILTVILSGSYPSFYLSKFNPVTILKPQSGKHSRKKIVMNLAGGFQIMITLFLLTFLFGINSQVQYLKNLSPGFNPEGLVNIGNLNKNIKSHYPAIRDQLLKIPEISGIAATSHTIGGGCSGQGIRLAESPEDNVLSINEYRIQPGLCELLELSLTEGRFFDPERETDRKGVILNEAALKMLGLTSSVGRQVVMDTEPMDIIGVVKDFRYESAANIVQPLVMTAYSNDMWTIMARVADNADMPATLAKIGQVLKSFDSGYIASANKTLDIYRNYYAEEERLGQLTRLGAALAVVIVMMGIFMLVSQSIARRTKEIGIRKVLGSSTLKMLALIYANSLKWTAVAAAVAIPLSYFVLQNWLQDYAVKTPLSWWLFVQGIAIILILETLITLGQTWRAATRNPVEALRYE
jgi:putative ABC transport system permease protein